MSQIIVVAEDPGLREVLTTQISDMGFEVKAFGDGASAKNALSLLKTAPDFMILDLVLPKVSGEDLLRWMRQHPRLKLVPVVILTGYRDDKSLKSTLRLGVRDYLLKPVPESLLRDRLACLKHSLESNDARAILSQCVHETLDIFESASFKRFRNKGYRPYRIPYGEIETIALCSLSFTRDQLMMLDEDLLKKHLRIYRAESPWLPIWPRTGADIESRAPDPATIREKIGDDLFDLVESCSRGENTRQKHLASEGTAKEESGDDTPNPGDHAA